MPIASLHPRLKAPLTYRSGVCERPELTASFFPYDQREAHQRDPGARLHRVTGSIVVPGAALHGGYFLRCRCDAFLGYQPGGSAEYLIEKAIRKGHVRAHESANRTVIYHIGARPFLRIASTSTWRRKPRNWTTFQVPWESIAATCLGASIARTLESRPLGTSWTSSRSSSRARSARGLLWSVLLHRRGGHKAIGLRYLLAAVQRSVSSAGLVPGGVCRGGPVYVCEGEEDFLAPVPGVRQRTERHAPRSGNPMTAGSFSRSRSVRATADGLVRQAPAGPTQR